MNAARSELIPAGVKVHFIKSTRGSYIRTPDGKFFAIRHSLSTALNTPKPILIAPQPPPPPPPPPISTLLDQLLYGIIKE
jgi:hypothetical protein